MINILIKNRNSENIHVIKKYFYCHYCFISYNCVISLILDNGVKVFTRLPILIHVQKTKTLLITKCYKNVETYRAIIKCLS